MKWFGILLLAVPLAIAAPERRSTNPFLGAILNIFHADEVKTIVQDLYHSMGTDEREVECEAECNKLVDSQLSSGSLNTIGHTACPLICHSYQELVHYFDVTPQTAAAAPAKRALNPFLSSILNVFHADEIKTIVTDLYQSMGTDEREAECESECNKLVESQATGSLNTIGHTACPLICHSFQELVHHFDINQQTAAAPAKRALNPFLSSILNVFHADEIKTIVTDLYHSMGSDEREVECEAECNKLVESQATGTLNTIGHTACPLICHSFQELVHHFDINQQTAAAPAKRALNPFLSSILNVFHADEIKTIVTDLYHSMGSDEREVECEAECNKLVESQATGTLNTIGHTACPLICHSFQELVHHFDINQQTAAAPAKRALNPFLSSILNVFHADEIKTIVTDLYHSMGSDEREVECEAECNKLVESQATGTLNTIGHTACPLICHSFQELVHHFDITPQTAVAPATGTSAKRSFGSTFMNSILNVFHADEIKTIVTDLYHSMGSDEREAECEKECNNLVDTQFSSGTTNTLGHTACPLICHSFQELVHHYDITPQTAVAPATGTSAKRSFGSTFMNSILNVFHADEIKTIVTDLYHSMGSDEREAECEKECNNLVDTQFSSGTTNTLGHTACPLICHSFQELVHHYDITPQTAVAPATGTNVRRSLGSSLLTSILNVFHADEIKTIVTDLYHSMGTDEREAECERECSNLIETQFHAGSLNTIGHTSCPLICHSFQELVHHFDIAPTSANPAPATSTNKRALNPLVSAVLNIFHVDEIKTIVTDLYHSMGSDEREAECEKECNNLVDTQFSSGTTNTLGHTACPLVCHSFQELVSHFDIASQTAPVSGTSQA
ncbi:uncharacterized protein [Argopecten irradians]|uniref:uncharacterized protein isoform X2 n=1 Tax=Argopecten irradians TaxID=31199 RepID=UPI0037107EAB